MNKALEIIAENSFIGAWFLEDLTICDDLIEYFENCPHRYTGYVFRGGQSIIDPSHKDSEDLTCDFNEHITQRYINQLHQVLELYKIKYSRADCVGRFGLESVNLQKYQPGGGYKVWHTERSDGQPPAVYRHLVFMTYLNTIQDQGQTDFLYQKVQIRPQKGLTLIWPSDWTHTHKSIPSETQIKYIATGWYTFLER